MRRFYQNLGKISALIDYLKIWSNYMFGMGFMEIFLVAVVAIIALGPDKLPSAMVDIAKMFKKLKGSLDDAKSTLDEELQISQMKEEANKFKSQFDDTKSSMKIDNLGFDSKSLLEDNNLQDIVDDDVDETSEIEQKPKKKKKKKVLSKPKKVKEAKPQNALEEDTNTDINEAASKFKVNFEDENKSETV